MPIATLIGYIMTVLPFFERFLSIYGNPHGIATILLMCFATVLGVTLILLLRAEQNKMNTLQVLSKDNRSLALRLLLVHQRLLRSKDRNSQKYKASRLTVSKATYSYKIKNSMGPFKDMLCTYKFTIKRASSKPLYILLVQDRGAEARSIHYYFRNNEREKTPAPLEPLAITKSEDHSEFAGLYLAEITFPDAELKKRGPLTLHIEFLLERAYNTERAYEAFVICPFIYARKMKSFHVHADFGALAEDLRPDMLSLRCYPYDGAKGMAERVANFKVPPKRKEWTGDIQRCHTNAVYFLEIKRPSN